MLSLSPKNAFEVLRLETPYPFPRATVATVLERHVHELLLGELAPKHSASIDGKLRTTTCSVGHLDIRSSRSGGPSPIAFELKDREGWPAAAASDTPSRSGSLVEAPF